MSEHGPGAAGSPSAALEPVGDIGQVVRIAWRWTMTYTQLAAPPSGADAVRGRTGPARSSVARRVVAVAARPWLWLANLLFLARHGPAVVTLGVAAACVPNPVRGGRGRRVLWPALGLLVGVAVVAALAVVTLLLVVASASSAGRAAAATGLLVLVGAGIGTLLLAVALLGLDQRGAVPDAVVNWYAAVLARSAGRPVMVGTSFGAWPRGTGDGSALLAAVLAELRADRVGLLVAARDDRVAGWYAAHGGRSISPDWPHVLAWPP